MYEWNKQLDVANSTTDAKFGRLNKVRFLYRNKAYDGIIKGVRFDSSAPKREFRDEHYMIEYYVFNLFIFKSTSTIILPVNTTPIIRRK